MTITEEQQRFRSEAQASSNCLTCKAVTECTAGGKSFPGCILCRKSGACSGPYLDWRSLEKEMDTDEEIRKQLEAFGKKLRKRRDETKKANQEKDSIKAKH